MFHFSTGVFQGVIIVLVLLFQFPLAAQSVLWDFQSTSPGTLPSGWTSEWNVNDLVDPTCDQGSDDQLCDFQQLPWRVLDGQLEPPAYASTSVEGDREGMDTHALSAIFASVPAPATGSGGSSVPLLSFALSYDAQDLGKSSQGFDALEILLLKEGTASFEELLSLPLGNLSQWEDLDACAGAIPSIKCDGVDDDVIRVEHPVEVATEYRLRFRAYDYDTEIGSFGDIGIDDIALTNGIIILDASTVVDRHIFYNDSTFDSNDPTANAADNVAIATDKEPLLPGSVSNFNNIISFTKGFNGLHVDIADLPGTPTEADFQVRVGNEADVTDFSPGPAPSSVTVGEGAGTDGADRVTLIFENNAIQNQWAEITLLATPNTGLSEPDTFYVGHLLAESGNDGDFVNSFDIAVAIDEVGPSGITSRSDFNRSGFTNSLDIAFAIDSVPNQLVHLSPPSGAAFLATQTQLAANTLGVPEPNACVLLGGTLLLGFLARTGRANETWLSLTGRRTHERPGKRSSRYLATPLDHLHHPGG